MIKHIVMWKIKEEVDGVSKKENIALLKERLLALRDKIDVIVDLEIGINSGSEDNYDVCLYSIFDSWNELTQYLQHPEHKKVAEFVENIREDRKAVDYEF